MYSRNMQRSKSYYPDYTNTVNQPDLFNINPKSDVDNMKNHNLSDCQKNTEQIISAQLEKLYEFSVDAYHAVTNAQMDDTFNKSDLVVYIEKILKAVEAAEAQFASKPNPGMTDADQIAPKPVRSKTDSALPAPIPNPGIIDSDKTSLQPSVKVTTLCQPYSQITSPQPAFHDTAAAQLALRAAADKAANDRGDPIVRAVLESSQRVGREIHRLMGLLRFTPGDDGIWLAKCAPDNSILPVFAGYFTMRFNDEPWAIIDEKRGLALVRLDGNEPCIGPVAAFPFLSESNQGTDNWEELWRSYHRSVNIANRKNPALQIQLMPRRYWKYLPELSSQISNTL